MHAGERQSGGGHIAAAFGRTAAPYPLRTHQHRALDRIDRLMINGGRRRAWVVLPPGAGKTLVGLEAIRRLSRPAVVFGPNTAIQAQWVRQWEAFSPATVRVGVDRSLDSPITALTYQSLATFDADEEVDEEGHGSVEPSSHRGALLDRLHPNGRALFEELRTMARLTVVLDECHHLLEVWGRLVAELLDSVPHAYVLGLTATPARSLTKDQAELVDDLFGHPVYATSIPSVVREGHIAPFAELAWLTTPTPTESRWLSAQAERFQELTTDLVDPAFGSVPFLTWLDQRFVARSPAVSWHRIERDEPELTDAALRLHHIGLLRLPDGARPREEHRQQPTAEDWVVLIDDWLRGRLLRSMDPRDQHVLAELRRTLPSVGFSLTKRGIRPGRSPVDRVLARSAAKTQAGVEIVSAEHRNLDDRLRMLILCDHERATATLPATLRGVLAAEAGSAQLMLERLAGDARTRNLGPMLVTGKTVAGHADVAKVFAAYVTDRDPSVRVAISPPNADGVVEITGRWSPRTWLPAVTSFFELGGCRVLVGTRGLLGEGWDARGVSGLVDLTTATTPTSVVQTRGRALRLDPSWPEKVAVTWTVVCVTEDHERPFAAKKAQFDLLVSGFRATGGRRWVDRCRVVGHAMTLRVHHRAGVMPKWNP
jgi:superfamily II DNA or RNA helicase